MITEKHVEAVSYNGVQYRFTALAEQPGNVFVAMRVEVGDGVPLELDAMGFAEFCERGQACLRRGLDV